MPSNCSVYGCSNTWSKTKGSHVKYFHFPKNKLLQDKWLTACRRADSVNVKYALICSVHFTPEDYKDDMKMRLLNLESPKNHRPLKEGAVPSLHLPNDTVSAEACSARGVRNQKRADKKLVGELLGKKNEEIHCASHKCSAPDITIEAIVPENVEIEYERLKRDLIWYKEENENLRRHINLLNENILQIIRNVVIQRTEDILSQFFTKTQVKAILTKKRVNEWSHEDIASALTLRSLSARCYKYLRVKKGFPLPCVSTLNKKARSFYCEPGILFSVLTLLKAKIETMAATERLAVLSLDEMSVSKEWSFDKGRDFLYEPHDKVLVIMLRGLVGRWKQPIYFDFDRSNVKEIVLMVIKQVEAIGFAVVAMVHDLGSANIRMWNELGIDPIADKISFKNPSAEREVYVFADVPHLIKLIRNNLIDSGFYLENKSLISVNSIKEMVGKVGSEYGLAYKLNEFHLTVSGQKRQRVKYAAQLLSKSCSNAIKYLGERNLLESSNWKETSQFISLINDWFDIMNSNHQYGDIPLRNGFGMEIDKQTEILAEVIQVMSAMKVKSPKTRCLYKFQKGVILSSKSTIGLFNMLKSKYNIKYIMTQRLNQDCLEHFFGCIRQMNGPHDHPNPTQFKYRLRTLLLGKDVSLISDKTNTNPENNNDKKISTSVDEDESKERAMALELCLTSVMFRNLDFEIEEEETLNLSEHTWPEKELENTATSVMEEEALRYIGGYIVKKFSKKYPHLGKKVETNVDRVKNWTEMVNRGELYAPSKEFFSQLVLLREVFNAIHGSSLRGGGNCISKLSNELKQSGVDIPEDVIDFFAKISIFFRLRYLNNKLKIEKTETTRGEKRKRTKLNM